jgi:NAD(P)-dependent dehydrogenase (short-subunit alcohol dehydrogenase family)
MEVIAMVCGYTGKTLVVKADVSKRDEVKELFGKVEQKFG